MPQIRILLTTLGLTLGASAAAQEPEDVPASDPAPAVIPVEEATPAEEESAAPTTHSRLVEEIVVTAQKREENLQDVPLSVQAFSGDMLAARGITDQKELPLVTPGMDVGTQISYTTVFLRGVGTDAVLTADPSVALYIDGIYFPFAQGLAQDFGAVERVEVLKGPQGTLFGRNANGGAINVITERPQFDEPSVSIQASAANWPDLQTQAHANLPLSDTFALSVSTIYNRSEWYVDGTAAGKPLPDDTTRGARVKARWNPADWMDLTVAGLRIGVDGAGSNFTPHHEPTPLGRLLGVQAQKPYKAELDSPIYNRLDNTVVYGQLSLFPGPFDVKVLGSHQDVDTAGWYDYDGSTQPIASFQPPKNFAVVDTAELQLLSNDSTWGSDWLKWIVGGYYFHGLTGFEPIYIYTGNVNTDVILGENPLIPDPLRAALLRLGDLVDPLATDGAAMRVQATLATNTVAAFVQTTITLTEWLDLTLGGRYQDERRSIDKSTFGTQVLDLPPTVLFDYDYAVDADGDRVGPSDTTKTFSPKVSFELHPFQDDTLVYLSYQEAVKSSTYNVAVLPGPPSYVTPETIKAFEIGIKTALFGGLTRFDAAAWYYDIDDLQSQFFSLLNGGVVSFENAPRARSYGFEYGIATPLFPSVVDDLVLLTGGAFIDAEYTKYPHGVGYEAPLYLFSQDVNLTGNRIVRSPRFTANLSLGKTWWLGNHSLELTGDWYHNSGYFLEATNAERSQQHAYDVLGARISWLYEPWGLRVTLFGKNLGDKLYSQGGQPNDFGDGLNYAPPRTYGVRVNWTF